MAHLQSHRYTWVFANPAAALTVLLIVLHQSLIASSAYFLTETISNYQADRAFQSNLIWYFLSMIVPFVPGCLSFVTTQHWINRLHRKFSLAMTSAVYGNLDDYRSSARKSEFESAISRNSFSVISSYVMLSHDFLSLMLNSVLSIVVIGIILPSEIAMGYAISLVLSIGTVFALSKTISTLSVDTEQRYASYGNTLHKAWDNMVLGNRYNSRLWLNEFDASSSSYYESSQKLAVYKQLGNIVIALVSLIPTAYLVYHLLVFDTLEPGIIAAIIVNLTRLFHILNSLSALAYELIEWTSASARLRYLLAFLTPHPGGKIPQAPVGHVMINGEPITDYQKVRETLHDRRVGRITIRGDNGAGKSTLLLSIKQAFANQAYLLPARNDQLCWKSPYGNLSTGQRACAIIDEVLQKNTEIRYLLLDEWDANLDQDNRQLIDQLLETLSKDRVVVEVRH